MKSLKKYLADIGSRGGRQRAANLTPERRTEIARIAGKARQAKAKKGK